MLPAMSSGLRYVVARRLVASLGHSELGVCTVDVPTLLLCSYSVYITTLWHTQNLSLCFPETDCDRTMRHNFSYLLRMPRHDVLLWQ